MATVLGLIEPFNKKMQMVLVFNFLGNLLVGTSYILADGLDGGAVSGAAICYVACIQVFINYYFTAKGKNIPVWVIIMHAVVFLALNLFTFKAWYDILALAAALMFVLSVSQSSSSHYRILYFLNSTTWIFYDLLSKSYRNLLTHIVLMVATFGAILIRDKKKSE